MADPLPTDAPELSPVGAVVLVTGPLLDGPTAAIVTAALPGDDAALTVTAFPPMAAPRGVTPVYPSGFPGDGYRYAIPWAGVELDADPGAGPDMAGDPPADPGVDPAAPDPAALP